MQLEKQSTPQLCTSLKKKIFAFPHAAEYKVVSEGAKEVGVGTEVF